MARRCLRLRKINTVAGIIAHHSDQRAAFAFRTGQTGDAREPQGVLVHQALLEAEFPNQEAIVALFRIHFEVDDRLADLLATGTGVVRSRKRAVKFFGWVFFLISSGSPHVRCTPTGRTCGEPDKIELTAMGVKLNGSRCRPL